MVLLWDLLKVRSLREFLLFLPFALHKIRFRMMFLVARPYFDDDIGLLLTCVGYIFRTKGAVVTGYGRFLMPWPGYTEFGGARFNVEAPIAVVVFLNDKPALVLAVELRRRIVCVRQLSGMEGVPVPDELRDWPRLMVEACMLFAKNSDRKWVRVYRADQDMFYKRPYFKTRQDEPREVTIKNIQQRMRRRYDGTAHQMGFVMKKKWGEWKNPHYARR